VILVIELIHKTLVALFWVTLLLALFGASFAYPLVTALALGIWQLPRLTNTQSGHQHPTR
jgi:ABC-type spermidine/putrescine transport system permease subunit II